jgi:hypothetical protein
VTTLAEEITAVQTGNIEVTDASGLSGTNFIVQIGAERIQVDYVDDTTLKIDTRGLDTTTAAAHKAGETIIEIITSSVFVFSGVQAKALDALYVISPITGEKIRVTTAYTTTLADTTTDTGRTISTVTFSDTNFKLLMDEIVAAAAVSTQPDFSQSGVDLIRLNLSSRTVADPATNAPWGFGGSPPTNQCTATLINEPPGLRCDASSSDDGACYTWFPTGSTTQSTRTVVRYRIVTKFNILGGGSYKGSYLMMSYDFLNQGAAGFIYLADTGTSEYGVVVGTAWKTPTAGTYTIANFEVGSWTQSTDGICYWLYPQGSGSWGTGNFFFVFVGESYVEVEVEPQALTRDTDVAIAGASMGYGIQFLADVQGAQTGGTLHESMPDIAEWFIEVFCGLTGAADATTFAQAETDLGSNKHAGVLNLLGESFGEVLAGLGYEGRCNFIASEGSSVTEYKCLAALSTYSFPAASKTLTEWRNLSLTTRSAMEQATRFQALYDLRMGVTEQEITEDHFEQIVRIDVDQNDASAKLATALLTAAEQKYGRRDAEPVNFYLCNDEATGEEVLAYYAHESIRAALRLGLSVPLEDGYDIELGDIVQLTPRGHSAAVKGRVTQTVYQLGEPRIAINLEEVE